MKDHAHPAPMRRWNDDQILDLIRQELDRRPPAAVHIEQTPPTPLGYRSWVAWAQWRIDGLMATANRWRDEAIAWRLRAGDNDGDPAVGGPTIVNGVIEMIVSGRLKEADIPDDYEWLVAKIGSARLDAAAAAYEG